MQKCNESDRWPDSPDAVPDEELDEFVAHAETCPYHGGLLRAEEEDLLSTLRLAACVSGRSPTAGAARDSGWWTEQAARFQRWAESDRPVRSVALRYRGEDVALHEWFDEVNTLVVRGLELEQGPGKPCALEIWKLPDEEEEEEVFLCAYPLGGFRHGGAAQYRELPNGQTLRLRVMHAFSNKYEIEFACVGGDSAGRAAWWPLGWHSQPAPWRRAPGPFWEQSPNPAPPPFGPIAIALVCLILPWLSLPSGYGNSDLGGKLKAPGTFVTTQESQELRAGGRKDEGRSAGPTRAPARRNLRVQPPPDVAYDLHTRQWGPRRPKPAAPATAAPTPTPVVSSRSYRNTCESDEPVQVAAEAPKPAAAADAEADAVETPSLAGDIREAGGDASPGDEATCPR